MFTNSLIANTIPPLAVPSNLVSIIPVILVISLKLLAWLIPFCPVVASITSNVSQGLPGTSFSITLFIFSNSLIKLALFCNLPAVSINTTSILSSLAFLSPSYITAEGSVLLSP